MEINKPIQIKHKKQLSQDSGTFLDWDDNIQNNNNSKNVNINSNITGEFVTVVAIESKDNDNENIDSNFITVLSINSNNKNNENKSNNLVKASDQNGNDIKLASETMKNGSHEFNKNIIICNENEFNNTRNSEFNKIEFLKNGKSNENHINGIVQNEESGYIEHVEEEILVYRLPGERLGFGLKFDGGNQNNDKIKRLFIQSCAKDSPAARTKTAWGNFSPGDEILGINNINIKNLTRIDCVKLLKESSVVLTLHVKHYITNYCSIETKVNSKNNSRNKSSDSITVQDVNGHIESNHNNNEINNDNSKSSPPPIPPRKLVKLKSNVNEPSTSPKVYPRSIISTKDKFHEMDLIKNEFEDVRRRNPNAFETDTTIRTNETDIDHNMEHSNVLGDVKTNINKLEHDGSQSTENTLDNTYNNTEMQDKPNQSDIVQEAEFYTNTFLDDDNHDFDMDESDDTGSSYSTVIDKLSIHSSNFDKISLSSTSSSNFSDIKSMNSYEFDQNASNDDLNDNTIDFDKVLEPLENESLPKSVQIINDSTKDSIYHPFINLNNSIDNLTSNENLTKIEKVTNISSEKSNEINKSNETYKSTMTNIETPKSNIRADSKHEKEEMRTMISSDSKTDLNLPRPLPRNDNKSKFKSGKKMPPPPPPPSTANNTKDKVQDEKASKDAIVNVKSAEETLKDTNIVLDHKEAKSKSTKQCENVDIVKTATKSSSSGESFISEKKIKISGDGTILKELKPSENKKGNDSEKITEPQKNKNIKKDGELTNKKVEPIRECKDKDNIRVPPTPNTKRKEIIKKKKNDEKTTNNIQNNKEINENLYTVVEHISLENLPKIVKAQEKSQHNQTETNDNQLILETIIENDDNNHLPRLIDFVPKNKHRLYHNIKSDESNENVKNLNKILEQHKLVEYFHNTSKSKNVKTKITETSKSVEKCNPEVNHNMKESQKIEKTNKLNKTIDINCSKEDNTKTFSKKNVETFIEDEKAEIIKDNFENEFNMMEDDYNDELMSLESFKIEDVDEILEILDRKADGIEDDFDETDTSIPFDRHHNVQTDNTELEKYNNKSSDLEALEENDQKTDKDGKSPLDVSNLQILNNSSHGTTSYIDSPGESKTMMTSSIIKSVKRLPPDGHEFPQTYQEQQKGYNQNIKSPTKPNNMLPPLPNTAPPIQRKLSRTNNMNNNNNNSKQNNNNNCDIKTDNYKINNDNDRYKYKNLDEKSEKSVRDKIAMFSNSNTNNHGQTTNNNKCITKQYKNNNNDIMSYNTTNNNLTHLEDFDINKSIFDKNNRYHESNYSESSAYSSLSQTEILNNDSNNYDYTSNDSSSDAMKTDFKTQYDEEDLENKTYHTKNQLDNSLNNDNKYYNNETNNNNNKNKVTDFSSLPRKLKLNKDKESNEVNNNNNTNYKTQLTRTISFNSSPIFPIYNRSQSLIDITHNKNKNDKIIDKLIEKRKKNISKLKGLIIPEKPENAVNDNNSIICDLPTIKNINTNIILNKNNVDVFGNKINDTHTVLERTISNPLDKCPTVYERRRNISMDNTLSNTNYTKDNNNIQNVNINNNNFDWSLNDIPKYSPAFKRKSLTVYDKSKNYNVNDKKISPPKPPRKSIEKTLSNESLIDDIISFDKIKENCNNKISRNNSINNNDDDQVKCKINKSEINKRHESENDIRDAHGTFKTKKNIDIVDNVKNSNKQDEKKAIDLNENIDRKQIIAKNYKIEVDDNIVIEKQLNRDDNIEMFNERRSANNKTLNITTCGNNNTDDNNNSDNDSAISSNVSPPLSPYKSYDDNEITNTSSETLNENHINDGSNKDEFENDNGELSPKRILKPASLEAEARKNVLKNAKFSSGDKTNLNSNNVTVENNKIIEDLEHCVSKKLNGIKTKNDTFEDNEVEDFEFNECTDKMLKNKNIKIAYLDIQVESGADSSDDLLSSSDIISEEAQSDDEMSITSSEYKTDDKLHNDIDEWGSTPDDVCSKIEKYIDDLDNYSKEIEEKRNKIIKEKILNNKNKVTINKFTRTNEFIKNAKLNENKNSIKDETIRSEPRNQSKSAHPDRIINSSKNESERCKKYYKSEEYESCKSEDDNCKYDTKPDERNHKSKTDDLLVYKTKIKNSNKDTNDDVDGLRTTKSEIKKNDKLKTYEYTKSTSIELQRPMKSIYNNRKAISVNDIKKVFESSKTPSNSSSIQNLTITKTPAINNGSMQPLSPISKLSPSSTSALSNHHHMRVSSLDSTTSDDSFTMHREQFGSITSIASSTSLISQQELQQLIDESNQSLEDSASGAILSGTSEVTVVVLHRDTLISSIGITLAGGSDYECKEITVHKVLIGSPADRDGRIQKGDRILSINGKSMKGVTHKESLAILKAPRSEVVLVVSRWKPNVEEINSVSNPSLIKTLKHSAAILEYPQQNATSETISRGPPVEVTLIKDGAGLGFSLEGGKDSPFGDQPLTIKKIFTGGCAEKNGHLFSGDEILAINNVSVTEMSRIEAWSLLKKLTDGKVHLTLRHKM